MEYDGEGFIGSQITDGMFTATIRDIKVANGRVFALLDFTQRPSQIHRPSDWVDVCGWRDAVPKEVHEWPVLDRA